MKTKGWIITLLLALMILIFSLLFIRPAAQGQSRPEPSVASGAVEFQEFPRIYIQ